MRGPGWLELSRSLCLGLGAAVPAEAECSRVLRGEQGLRAEGPGSFLHSILQMKKGQTEGGDQGKCKPEEASDNTLFVCLHLPISVVFGMRQSTLNGVLIRT